MATFRGKRRHRPNPRPNVARALAIRILLRCGVVFQAVLIIIKLSQATILAPKLALAQLGRPKRQSTTWRGRERAGEPSPGTADNNNATTTNGAAASAAEAAVATIDHRYHHIAHSALLPQREPRAQCGHATRRKPTRILLPRRGLLLGTWVSLAWPRYVTLSPCVSLSLSLSFCANNAQDGFLTVSYARKFNAPTWETRHGGQANAARRCGRRQQRRRQQR